MPIRQLRLWQQKNPKHLKLKYASTLFGGTIVSKKFIRERHLQWNCTFCDTKNCRKKSWV